MDFAVVGELLKEDIEDLTRSLNTSTPEIIDAIGFVYDYDYKTVAWSDTALDDGYIKQLLLLHEQEYPNEDSNL